MEGSQAKLVEEERTTCINKDGSLLQEDRPAKTYAYARTISKKKYLEIQEAFAEKYDKDLVHDIMFTLCEVLALDPDLKCPYYSKELGLKLKEQRHQRMAETGLSSYVLSGRQKQHTNEKAAKVAMELVNKATEMAREVHALGRGGKKMG
jgi:hypothetical protein